MSNSPGSSGALPLSEALSFSFTSLHLSERKDEENEWVAPAEEDPALGSAVDAQYHDDPIHLENLASLPLTSSITLRSLDFRPLRFSLKKQHMKGTRKWILDRFLLFLSSRESSSKTCSLFVLLGGAGTGKSVIIAYIHSSLLSPATPLPFPVVVASHYSRFTDPSVSSLSSLLSSLSAQLASLLPPFSSALLRDAEAVASALSTGDSDDLFDALLLRPLEACSAAALPTHPRVVLLLDALDELPALSLRPVLSLLERRFPQLPSFVVVFVSSREQDDVKRALNPFEPVELRVDDMANRQDLREYLSHVAGQHVSLRMSMADIEEAVNKEWAGFDARGKLKELEEPLSKSRMYYDLAADRISGEKGYRELCRIAEMRSFPPLLQDPKPGVDPSDTDSLFLGVMDDAHEAREVLRSIVAEAWEQPDGSKFQVPKRGTARHWVDNAIDPNLKGVIRAREKAMNDYGGDVLLLKDIARISLEFRSCARMYDGFLELVRAPNLQVVSLKNKYANPTPMGYRDLNLSVRVTLKDGRSHICEVQINLVEMLRAKSIAHSEYEVVRTKLPEICRVAAADVKADDVEKFVMKLLRSSVLDSAVKMLENKTGGLFIYARLLEEQLKTTVMEKQDEKVDFSCLGSLPKGLSEMYTAQFKRTFPDDAWGRCKKVVAMISVAREPLPEELVERIVGVVEYREVKRAMSLLFPEREGALHVMHKSVVDWLKDEERMKSRENFTIVSTDIAEANLILAYQIWLYDKWQTCGVEAAWDFELRGAEKYAVTYGHVHLTEAIMRGALGAAKHWSRGLFCSRNTKSIARDDAENEVCASLSSARWLMEQAKLERTPRFLSELRVLNDSLDKYCDDDVVVALKNFVRDTRWLLGNVFNLEYPRKNLTFFQEAAVATMANAPITSAWYDSEGERTFLLLRIGMFRCLWTMPERVRISPVLMDLKGHNAYVKGVAFSPDSTRIVSGANDSSVRVWDAGSGDDLLVLRGHSAEVSSVAYNVAGTKIASGSYDKTAKIWEAESGVELATLTGHTGSINSVAFGLQNKLLTSSSDKTAKVWDLSVGDAVLTLSGHSGAVFSAAFDRSGSKIVTGASDKVIKVWSAVDGIELFALSGHFNTISSVAFSADASRVVSASGDKTAKVWDATRGGSDSILTLRGHSRWVTCCVFSTDDTRIVTASRDESVRVWDASAGHEILRFNGTSNWVTAVAFSIDGTKVVSGSYDKTVKVWDASAAGDEIRSVWVLQDRSASHSNTAASRAASGALDTVYDNGTGVANDADFRLGDRIVSRFKGWEFFPGIVVAQNEDGTFAVNYADGDQEKNVAPALIAKQRFEAQSLKVNSNCVFSAAFSSDGKKIVVGLQNASVMVFDAETRRLLLSLQGHAKWVTSTAFNPDATTVASGSFDTCVRLWNAETGDALHTMEGHSCVVRSVSFNGDGSEVASGSADTTVRVWSAATGEELAIFKGHLREVTAVDFSKDGSFVVSASLDNSVRIWNRTSAGPEAHFHLQFPTASALFSVAFNVDRTLIAGGAEDGTVSVWDAKEGLARFALKDAHASSVSAANFSNDGSIIVTGSWDKTVKVWNADTGELVQTLKGHTGAVYAASLCGDGTAIVSGSGDSSFKVWHQAC